MNVRDRRRERATIAMEAFVAALQEVEIPSPVSRVLIYGSCARGDSHTESDVDVAVVLEGGRGDLKRNLSQEVRRGTKDAIRSHGFLVSPVVLWEEDLTEARESGTPGFLDNILREAVERKIGDGCPLP